MPTYEVIRWYQVTLTVEAPNRETAKAVTDRICADDERGLYDPDFDHYAVQTVSDEELVDGEFNPELGDELWPDKGEEEV